MKVSYSFRKSLVLTSALFFATAAPGLAYSSAYGDWLRGNGDDWSSVAKSDVRRLAELGRRGDVDAMRKLGIMSMTGDKVKKSAKIAIQWWEKAASRGDARSMMYLGDVYRGGNGCRKDLKRAMSYYAKAYSTVERDGDEDILQGDDDNVVIQRIKKLPLSASISWWKERARMKDVYAMYHLASLKKKDRKDELSDEEACEYMIMAALNGHNKAKSKIEGADPAEYLTYWEKKAEEGSVDDWITYARALSKQENLSPADEKKVAHYYRKAALMENVEAKSWLSAYEERCMDKCVEYLLAGSYSEAVRELRTMESESETTFDPAPVLSKLLSHEGVPADAVSVLVRRSGFREAETNQDVPFILLAIRNKQSADVVNALIRARLDVNAACKQSGETALIAATKSNSIDIVDILLRDSNIDVSVKDNQGLDALSYAKDENVKQLISRKVARVSDSESCVAGHEFEIEPPATPELPSGEGLAGESAPKQETKTSTATKIPTINVEPPVVKLPELKEVKEDSYLMWILGGVAVLVAFLGGYVFRFKQGNVSRRWRRNRGDGMPSASLRTQPPAIPPMPDAPAHPVVPPPIPVEVVPVSAVDALASSCAHETADVAVFPAAAPVDSTPSGNIAFVQDDAGPVPEVVPTPAPADVPLPPPPPPPWALPQK